jgi:hypothetical protein
LGFSDLALCTSRGTSNDDSFGGHFCAIEFMKVEMSEEQEETVQEKIIGLDK